MSTPNRISVVIPTYQRCASLQRLLQALVQQTMPPDQFEVIVSIDGSADGTHEMAAQLRTPFALQVLWQPNQGRASACNAGIEAACGELVVLLDDDMAPAPEFLAAHQRAHAHDFYLGVVGAVPVQLAQTAPPVVRYIGEKFNRHLEKLAQMGYRLALRDFYSGNFSIRRELIRAVGSFDPAFTIYGNEDLELYARLRQAGVEVVYSPEALAYQHYTKDFAALAYDNIAKGRTAVLLAHKHPATLAELKLSTYTQSSPQWRLLRTALLAVSRVCPQTPKWVIWFVRQLEQRRPSRFDLYYSLALDYCYWLGAQSELRRQRQSGGGLPVMAAPAERSSP
ncbi:MAG TPA: glycosyltransferase family 2 protein [Caldilineaceae bacterium]|nr:glycosyltransferase family 2 protein [Caldilineaceae bacterium]